MFIVKDYRGELLGIDKTELQSYALGIYSELKSLNETRRARTRDYLRELNGNSAIPEPEMSWQSNIRSSLFFQKVIFAYLYLRSLIDKSSRNLLAFYSANPYSKMPSILKKIYDYAVYRSDFFKELSKAVFYGILSGELVLLIDSELTVDNFGDIEKKVLVKAIHPLAFYRSNDDMFYAYDVFLPIEKAYRLANFWSEKPSEIKPYNASHYSEEVEYYTRSSSRRAYAKITYIYGRYINSTTVSEPLKITILNDTELVDVEPITHLDGLMPFVYSAFYTQDMQSSYADLIWDYYKEDTRLIRSFIDRVLLSTATAFEIDTSQLINRDGELVIKPFMVIEKTGSDQAVNTFSLASIDPNALPFRHLILQEAQNITALTEFLMGLPTSKGRPTAREVLLKTQMNQQVINTLINRLEDEFITNAIRKLLTVYLQINLDEVLRLLTPEEQAELNSYINQAVLEDKPPAFYIVKEIYKGITIRVEGLSGVIRQKDELESLLSILELFGDLGALSFINVPLIVKRIADILQLPSELIRIPTPEEMQAMAMAQAKKNKEIAEFLKQILSNEDILQKVAPKSKDLLSYLNIIAEAQNDSNSSA